MAANNTKDVRAAHEALGKLKLVDGSVTAAFQWAAKSKITYSHCQHTTTKAWYVPSPLKLLVTSKIHADHPLDC